MKKGYSKIWLVAISTVIILAVLSLSACSTSNPPATTTASLPPTTAAASPSPTLSGVLKIGFITPSTGAVGYKGLPGQHGYLDAVSYINTELGGINGYQIKPLWYDSAYDKAKVATIVKDLMDQGALMFATMSSTEALASSEIANRAGFPGLSTYTAANIYRPPQHIYGQAPDYGDDWVAFTNYYMNNIWKGTGKPKMALHLLSNPTGSAVRDAAKAKADSLGVDIVDIEEHSATTIDETESLTRIKAKNPDVMFISSTDQPTAIILKNARQLGMKLTIGLGHAGYSKALVDLAGADLIEGIYVPSPVVTWDDNAAGLAKAKEYVQKTNSKDSGDVNYLSCWATTLTIGEILKNAVKNAGYAALAKGDADAWKAIEQSGIQKLSNYGVEGLQGAVSYTPGDNRLAKSLKIYTVKAGQLVAVSGWVDAPVTKYEDFSWWGK
jgi:branched-chain amino acid transport system substrate-binding protein